MVFSGVSGRASTAVELREGLVTSPLGHGLEARVHGLEAQVNVVCNNSEVLLKEVPKVSCW